MPRTYTLSVSDVIANVRTLVQDAVEPYRTADAEIIGWLNDAIRATVPLLPQNFTKVGTHTCTPGSHQTFTQDRAYSILDVMGVPAADYASMSAFIPGWQYSSAGAIQNWLRPLSEPLDFFTYPPQAGGEELKVLYVEIPAALVSSDNVPLPENYVPAVVQYCVAMLSSKDDENVDTNRAAQAMLDYVGRITGGK